MPQCGKMHYICYWLSCARISSGPWRIYAEINPSGTTLSKIHLPCMVPWVAGRVQAQKGRVPLLRLLCRKRQEEGSIEAASPKPLRKEAIKKQVFNACRAGDVDMLESMFKAGVPANLMDEKNKSDTPLMVACQIGNAALVRLCLQYGAKNDPHPDFGETALHVACRFKHQGSCIGHP